MKTQQSISAVTDNVQGPKSETLQNSDTYRAPRLVTLGTAVGLVQYSSFGSYNDAARNGRATRP